MDDPDVVRVFINFFTFLTVVVDVLVVAGTGFIVFSVVKRKGAGVWPKVPEVLSDNALRLAAAIAITCTLGSLYFSEIVGFVPCRLCWFQRICMYPLSAILIVGLLRKDSKVWTYAIPFLVVGPAVSIYHLLIERGVIDESSSCSSTVPCATPYFTRFEFITLAWMALSGFLGIAALLFFTWRGSEMGRQPVSEVRSSEN